MKTATQKVREADKTYQLLQKYLGEVESRIDAIMTRRRKLIMESTNKISAVDQEISKIVRAGVHPIGDLVQQLAEAQKQEARQIRGFSSADEELKKTIAGIKSSIQEAERSLSAATLAHDELKSRHRGVVKTIESKDARLVRISQKEQESLRDKIRKLDAEIASRSKESLVKDKARSAARENLEKATMEAESKGGDLLVAGHASFAFQYALEVQSSALNLALAAKGGPAGLLAEATSQLVGLGISRPSYYDASGIGRGLAAPSREPSAEDQSGDWPPEGGARAIRDQAFKEALAIPFRALGDYANLREAGGEYDRLRRSWTNPNPFETDQRSSHKEWLDA